MDVVVADVMPEGVEENDKDWPVTTQDLDDARAHQNTSDTSDSTTGGISAHAFIDCSDEVPSLENVTATRVNGGDDFKVAWDHVDGCVDDITIDRMSVSLTIEFDNADSGFGARKLLKGNATGHTFSMDPWDELDPVAGTIFVKLFPDDREYGGQSYDHAIEIDKFK